MSISRHAVWIPTVALVLFGCGGGGDRAASAAKETKAASASDTNKDKGTGFDSGTVRVEILGWEEPTVDRDGLNLKDGEKYVSV